MAQLADLMDSPHHHRLVWCHASAAACWPVAAALGLPTFGVSFQHTLICHSASVIAAKAF
jgi:hypothetical protein